MKHPLPPMICRPAKVSEVLPGEVFHDPDLDSQMEFIKLCDGQVCNAINTTTWATAEINPTKIVRVIGTATLNAFMKNPVGIGPPGDYWEKRICILAEELAQRNSEVLQHEMEEAGEDY